MPDILSITAPIYLLMALGYAVVRSGWLSPQDMRSVGQFVIRVALPALLFQLTAARPLHQLLNGPFLLAYAGGSALLFGLAWWWARGRGRSMRAFIAAGMTCSNTGFVGTPVLLNWMGDAGAPALAMVFMVENLVMLPMLFVLAEPEADASGTIGRLRHVLAPLWRTPMLWAIVLGLLFSALGWTLPGPVGRSVGLMAQASAGVALLVIGGALAGLQRGQMGPEIALVAAGKLLLHPLAVGLAAWALMPAGEPLRAAAVVLAAAPMFSIYPVLAQRHGHEGFCAASLLVATGASFATLSGVLWAMGHWAH